MLEPFKLMVLIIDIEISKYLGKTLINLDQKLDKMSLSLGYNIIINGDGKNSIFLQIKQLMFFINLANLVDIN